MLTLGIETAADTCAVALSDGATPLVELAILRPRSHATRLTPMISDALAHVGAQPADLEVVAVSSGPGSYTGLRIGLSTAKGLCLASGAALAAVPTLDALADAALDVANEGDGVVIAARSRRGEIYGAAFEIRNHELATVHEAAPVAIADLPDWLPSHDTMWVLGDAAPHVLKLLGAAGRLLTRRPSALSIARRGHQLVTDGLAVDVATYEPSYLKAFEATQPRAIFQETGS